MPERRDGRESVIDRDGDAGQQITCAVCGREPNISMYSEELGERRCPNCWPDEWDFPHERKLRFF